MLGMDLKNSKGLQITLCRNKFCNDLRNYDVTFVVMKLQNVVS